MPKMVVTHDVQDIARWLEGQAERRAVIESLGGSNVTDHVATDGSNHVAITADVAEPEALLAFLASPPPEALEVMASHGVIPPITSYIEG